MNSIVFKKIVVVVIGLLSPVIYLKISSICNVNIFFNVVYGINSKSIVTVAIVKVLTCLVSAIVTAFITVLPCVYLLPLYRKYIVIVFIVAILIFPVSTFFMLSNYDKLSFVDVFGQSISVIISVYLFATIGFFLGLKGKRNI